LPIRHASWSEIRALTRGLEVVLSEMDASLPCWQADLRKPLALVVGGEAEGASGEAHSLATRSVSIPMPGGCESLNAAVAGAILMFEVVRQRL
jgi:RNA methyltransferase, TrmH family